MNNQKSIHLIITSLANVAALKGAKVNGKAHVLWQVNISTIVSTVYRHIAHSDGVIALFSWILSEMQTLSGKEFGMRVWQP